MSAISEVETELAIWDRKIFVERPVFLQHEGGIRSLRRWYAQFYPPAAAPEEGLEPAVSSATVRTAG